MRWYIGIAAGARRLPLNIDPLGTWRPDPLSEGKRRCFQLVYTTYPRSVYHKASSLSKVRVPSPKMLPSGYGSLK